MPSFRLAAVCFGLVVATSACTQIATPGPAPVPASVTTKLSTSQSTTFTVGVGTLVATLTILPSSNQDTLTVSASTAPPAGAVPLAIRHSGGSVPVLASAANPQLYVNVIDGSINVNNGSTQQQFTAGQFGFVPGLNQPPIVLPQSPGIQFSVPTPGQTPTFNVVDCTITGTPSNNGYVFSNVPIVATASGTTYAMVTDLSQHC